MRRRLDSSRVSRATFSSPPITVSSSPTTICRTFPNGCRTRSASSAKAAAKAAASFSPTRTRVLLYARAPFLLTGIENVVVRGDLAQRTLFIHLASVPNAERLTEDDFKGRLKRAHAGHPWGPVRRGEHGLRREKTLKLPALPRMATFFHWVSACEPALWEAGTFEAAYESNAKGATEDVIEGEKSASVLRGFMASRARWQGTATQLLGELVAFVKRPVREAEAASAEASVGETP